MTPEEIKKVNDQVKEYCKAVHDYSDDENLQKAFMDGVTWRMTHE